MKSHRQRAIAAGLAALAVPAAIALSAAPPAAVAASALFAEGTAQKSGEAQTAFRGAFCQQNTCRSISPGPLNAKTSSQQIQTAVAATTGDIIVVGYSLGAAGVYDRMREWAKNPSLAPDPSRVVIIVTYGNPENKFGGQSRKNAGAGLPAVQPYQHLDVTEQYDSAADKPTRYGFYSTMNIAFSPRHFDYFKNEDINDPTNLVYTEGNTTYMLIRADVLPMLTWIQPFVSAQRLAELDAKYRPLVERDYDRPAYVPQGEGADWGNGNPPPSVSGAATQQLRVTQETPSASTALAVDDQPAVAKRSTKRAVKSEQESVDADADTQDPKGAAADDDADDVSKDETKQDSKPAAESTSAADNHSADSDRDASNNNDSADAA